MHRHDLGRFPSSPHFQTLLTCLRVLLLRRRRLFFSTDHQGDNRHIWPGKQASKHNVGGKLFTFFYGKSFHPCHSNCRFCSCLFVSLFVVVFGRYFLTGAFNSTPMAGWGVVRSSSIWAAHPKNNNNQNNNNNSLLAVPCFLFALWTKHVKKKPGFSPRGKKTTKIHKMTQPINAHTKTNAEKLSQVFTMITNKLK